MSKLLTEQEIRDQIAAEREALKAAHDRYTARRAELSAAAGRILFHIRRDAGLTGADMARIIQYPQKKQVHHECRTYVRRLDPESVLEYIPVYEAAVEFMQGDREKPLLAPRDRNRGRTANQELRAPIPPRRAENPRTTSIP